MYSIAQAHIIGAILSLNSVITIYNDASMKTAYLQPHLAASNRQIYITTMHVFPIDMILSIMQLNNYKDTPRLTTPRLTSPVAERWCVYTLNRRNYDACTVLPIDIISPISSLLFTMTPQGQQRIQIHFTTKRAMA